MAVQILPLNVFDKRHFQHLLVIGRPDVSRNTGAYQWTWMPANDALRKSADTYPSANWRTVIG